MTTTTTNKTNIYTGQKPVFTARVEGISVIAWLTDNDNEYSIRAFAPRNLSISDAQWLAVTLVKAQDAVKKAIYAGRD